MEADLSLASFKITNLIFINWSVLYWSSMVNKPRVAYHLQAYPEESISILTEALMLRFVGEANIENFGNQASSHGEIFFPLF